QSPPRMEDQYAAAFSGGGNGYVSFGLYIRHSCISSCGVKSVAPRPASTRRSYETSHRAKAVAITMWHGTPARRPTDPETISRTRIVASDAPGCAALALNREGSQAPGSPGDARQTLRSAAAVAAVGTQGGTRRAAL